MLELVHFHKVPELSNVLDKYLCLSVTGLRCFNAQIFFFFYEPSLRIFFIRLKLKTAKKAPDGKEVGTRRRRFFFHVVLIANRI